MTAYSQTLAALLIVVLAAGALVWRAIAHRKGTGCGDGCGAVSPEARAFMKKLQKK